MSSKIFFHCSYFLTRTNPTKLIHHRDYSYSFHSGIGINYCSRLAPIIIGLLNPIFLVWTALNIFVVNELFLKKKKVKQRYRERGKSTITNSSLFIGYLFHHPNIIQRKSNIWAAYCIEIKIVCIKSFQNKKKRAFEKTNQKIIAGGGIKESQPKKKWNKKVPREKKLSRNQKVADHIFKGVSR